MPSGSGPRTNSFGPSAPTPLRQEIIFASTGTKKPSDPPWKYVEAFAGSDIQTNPPATNEAVARSNRTFTRQVDRLPPPAVVEEIDRLVDMEKLEATLMAEGIAKFANPQKALLALVAKKRATAQLMAAARRLRRGCRAGNYHCTSHEHGWPVAHGFGVDLARAARGGGRAIDDARAAAAGIRKLPGKRLTLYTDLAGAGDRPVAGDLRAGVSAVVPYFGSQRRATTPIGTSRAF